MRKRTIYLVSTVQTGKSLLSRAVNKFIMKTRIVPPLYRFGIDWLIPWQKPLRSPHGSSRNLLLHLKKFGKVRFYTLYEKGTIRLKPGDFFLGQPMPKGGFSMDTRPDADEPDSVTSATLRANKDTNHNKCLIVPFASDKVLMSWAHDLAKNYADKIVLIGATNWAKDWKNTPFGDIDPKRVLAIDNAVDSSEYPRVKFTFNPPEKRRFLYLGHTGWYKNTQMLEKIAEAMPGFDGAHIGQGEVKGWKNLGYQSFTPEFLKKMADEYDIFLTTSTADAQATTIMEFMCYGFPIACTPETGYVYPSVVRLDVKDTAANVKMLSWMKNLPEAELRKMADDNYKLVRERHSWEVYVNRVSKFMGLNENGSNQ
jgi:glycosyltransferase involved in cell wall biosynthesis